MENIIEISNLHKRFGKVHALAGISFEVKKGEVFGFLGPNGAGKSTTIRILLGMLKADEGAAKIFGKNVWKDIEEIHSRLTYVPGELNLWKNLTGGEVVDLFIKMRRKSSGKLTAQEKAAKENLGKLFELDYTKKCRSYSKGNKQKVALVSAFATDADLLIFDEPTSGLDPLMEKKFQELVLEKKQQGKAVLLSSHILSEVDALADRIGIIKEGKMIEVDSLEKIKQSTSLEDLFLESYTGK